MDDKAEKEVKSPLLIPLLCDRLKQWRQEIGQETHPHLEDGVREALANANTAQVEEGLVIYVIARCEYWFRTCQPSETDIKRALSDLLQNTQYTPYRTAIDLPSGISIAVKQHIDRYLATEWDSEASEVTNNFIRKNLLERTNKVASNICYPFLVSEHLRLPGKRGGYADWAPWVAASVVYQVAIRQSPTEQDSKPRKAAEAVVCAMRGRYPDKSAFHTKRREISKRASRLVKALTGEYQKAKMMTVMQENNHPFVEEYSFPSLRAKGGWALLVGQVPDTTECFDNSVKS